MSTHFPLLDTIENPYDLRSLSEAQLPVLAGEIRAFLIETLGQVGGHFAANLGTVELTIALHYVFQTPDDQIIWDVGHQGYTHKMLTGRLKRMETIRRWGGLAPFPKRQESPFDTFGVGHASTAISAAVGMAEAFRLLHESHQVVAIVGDGGITGGMTFEAMNHAGALKTDMLVILNDNEMSISPNVGALSNYFSRILSSRLYTGMREGGKTVLQPIPPMKEFVRRAEEHLKGMVIPGTLFEELGFNYVGPIDGHQLTTLVETLRNMRQQRGPRLLHVITRKGKGFAPAEKDPVKYHGVGAFNPQTGVMVPTRSKGPSYSAVFGAWLCDVAEADRRVVGITPAMREGSGMVEFEQRFPERYFDVAIAEQHAVTFAAGLACQGMRPVVAIYSTFLQRAYDQVVHDVALQNLPVLFAIDRAGLVGPDGPTHAGIYDLGFLRSLPGFTIMMPVDENESYQMLSTGLACDGPVAVRYPRGQGPGVPIEKNVALIPLGKAEIVRCGKGVAILCFGSPMSEVLKAALQIDATVVNMRFVKPIDTDMIMQMAENYQLLVTVEEHMTATGAGSAVLEVLHAHGIAVDVLNVGIPDRIIEHGSREEMLVDAGLDAAGIQYAIEQRMKRKRIPMAG